MKTFDPYSDFTLLDLGEAGWGPIEVDGDIHDLQQEEDARRDVVLRKMGLRIVRFKNDEVVKNLPMVLRTTRELLLT